MLASYAAAARKLALGLTALVTVGCAGPALPAAPVPEPPAALAEAGVTVTAHVGRARTLLDALPGWGEADIQAVRVDLYQDVPNYRFVAATFLASDQLDRTLTYSPLQANTKYLVRVQAFADAERDVRIDDEDDSESCTTRFTTTAATSQDVGALKLKLRDRVYAAATPALTIAVTEGTVIYEELAGRSWLPPAAEDLAR